MLERGGSLPRHDLGDLAGFEVVDLDLASDHIDAGIGGIHRHAELGAFDDGGKIRRLDLEMLDVTLLDFEQDGAGPLHDGR